MKICETAKSRAAAVKSIRPERIAVAFLGKDWQDYVDPRFLQQVIVSPQLGSNPFAIEKLADDIGWENLYLLEHLHSKLYIGKGQAFLGSSNLSAKGFGVNGNYELGVRLTHESSIRQLSVIFESYRAQAHDEFRTEPQKRARLAQLVRDCQIADANGLTFEDAAPNCANRFSPSIENRSKLHRIHIFWGSSAAGGKVNRQLVRQEIPEIAREDDATLEEFFSGFWEVHPDDDIRVGDWILGWGSTHAGVPAVNAVGNDLAWYFVDVAIKNGYTGTEYTQLVGPYPNRCHSDPPFDLNGRTRRAIMDVLRSGKFPQMLGTYQDSSPWRADAAFPFVDAFLDEVSRRL